MKEIQDTATPGTRMNRVHDLIRRLERIADPDVRGVAAALVQEIIDFHGEGLNRMLEMTYENAGQDLVDRLAEDELIGSLLLLHDLHPVPMEARIRQALDAVRPVLRAHGGSIDLLRLTPGGDVHLRLDGDCPRCSSSHENLHTLIEETVLQSAPDASGIYLEGEIRYLSQEGDGFIPISTLRARP